MAASNPLHIRSQLIAMAEPGYQQFASALFPGITNMLGIRLPQLRKVAKQLAREDWRTYTAFAAPIYFEEIMLQGMVIGYVQVDPEELLEQITAFVPKIDNWSVCDSFCAGLKAVRVNRERVWEFLQPYLASSEPYAVRFAVVMLLNYYVDEQYAPLALPLLEQIRHEHYYVKMAVAWAISFYYLKLPELAAPFLAANALDAFTHNKALQKILESQRIAPEAKDWIRGLKRATQA